MAFIGKLAWNALGWAMPGLSAAWLYLVAGGLAFGLVGSVAFFKGQEGKSAAVTAANASCEIRIANTRTAAMQTMADLLDTIQNDPAQEPKTSAEELKLCKASKLCREGGVK